MVPLEQGLQVGKSPFFLETRTPMQNAKIPRPEVKRKGKGDSGQLLASAPVAILLGIHGGHV